MTPTVGVFLECVGGEGAAVGVGVRGCAGARAWREGALTNSKFRSLIRAAVA